MMTSPEKLQIRPDLIFLTLLAFISVITGVIPRLIYFDQIEFGIDGVTAILTTRFWLTHGVLLDGLCLFWPTLPVVLIVGLSSGPGLWLA
jgi:hypothetical protein